MPAQVSADELFAELSALTLMDEGEWRDFCSLPPAGQAIAAQIYRDASWTKSESVLPRVLAILETLGQIAGAITGIAGAVGAVIAIKNALK